MTIKVDAESLLKIAEAIKNLPVRGDYNDADRWVGCVLSLEMIANNSEVIEEPTEE